MRIVPHEGLLRLGGETKSVGLGEPLLRDRDGHLARLRLHEIGKREHGAVCGAAQKADNHEKADQTGHRGDSSATWVVLPQDLRDSALPAARGKPLTITFRPNWQGPRRRGICWPKSR